MANRVMTNDVSVIGIERGRSRLLLHLLMNCRADRATAKDMRISRVSASIVKDIALIGP